MTKVTQLVCGGPGIQTSQSALKSVLLAYTSHCLSFAVRLGCILVEPKQIFRGRHDSVLGVFTQLQEFLECGSYAKQGAHLHLVVHCSSLGCSRFSLIPLIIYTHILIPLLNFYAVGRQEPGFGNRDKYKVYLKRSSTSGDVSSNGVILFGHHLLVLLIFNWFSCLFLSLLFFFFVLFLLLLPLAYLSCCNPFQIILGKG